jgi:hypothetical protein
MAGALTGTLEGLEAEGAVREAALVALLGAEVRNAREQVANRALSAALAAVQGANEEALARVLGRGPGGRGAAPRVMALGLLHLAAQAAEAAGAGVPGAAAPLASFGALAAGSEFMAAYEAELRRVARLLASGHAELRAALADLGRQLPPAGAAGVAGAAGAAAAAGEGTAGGAGAAAAAELAECARLRAEADAAAARLIALDDAGRAATGALARLAAAYDEVMAEAAARLAAAAAGAPPGSPRKRSGRCEAPPLTAVRSHSAPGGQGKYTAGERHRGGWYGHQQQGHSQVSRRLAPREGPDSFEAARQGSAPSGRSRIPPTARLQPPSPGPSPLKGVPPDVYHTSLHRILTASGAATPEPALWALSVAHARLRHREATAKRAAGSGGGAAAAEWTAPDKVRGGRGGRRALQWDQQAACRRPRPGACLPHPHPHPQTHPPSVHTRHRQVLGAPPPRAARQGGAVAAAAAAHLRRDRPRAQGGWAFGGGFGVAERG